jgi:uncharacterized protein (TIGR02271 family)
MHTNMQTHLNEVQPGWDVIDRLGEKIGDVNTVESDYLVLTKGLIFVKDLYVPLEAIDKVDTADQTVTLNVQKADIDETRWAQAPAASSRGAFTEGSSDFTDGSSDNDTVLTVKEERIRADKARKQTGEVAVGKRIVEQQADMDVDVTHEEVEVTRRRVDRPADANETFTEDEATIRVPVTAEEVSVTKEPRVVEEIVVSKRPVTETKRVSDTVRREEVILDETGDARLRGDDATQRRDAYARDSQAYVRADRDDDDDLAGQAGGAAAGAVGGAAVGAAVGGPPGAVVGGVIGAAGGAAAGDAVEDEVEGDKPR